MKKHKPKKKDFVKQLHAPATAQSVGNVLVLVECHARFCTVDEGSYHDDETREKYEYRTGRQKERDEVEGR
ncbi:hypothetical protein BU25DRAFT_406087 [Macroventuria anomochaeta]|uniref:Uncharacterized protein n=1 Tax=Macroventuria anomochaeta TaxID=301207 RepID=A0ACB6SEX0_9PLEO|nr:uncharacterized protein BU25DRAFT_406087 [Macroventuria anomochaeta]KAF2632776.1 hypothetical protein BU25DRAFT_406087 [Macroventuria anomochaeta]